MLQPKVHFDLTNLPEDLAAEFGRLIVHIARAVESLPNIARAHVSRWGDGGAHLHVFFFARPEGFVQLRGTCFAIWDDLLPPTPRVVRDADALSVARALSASYGGDAIAQ
jgi:diadenosine tetraphosphate (Ap4A) HIT family hydrolase